MQLSEKIKAIETKTTRHPDWFYHAFFPDTETYTSMLAEGIKCRKLSQKEKRKKYGYVGHNGNHYISLSKMETTDEHNSSFIYYQSKPAFIIEGIKPKKCHYSFEQGLLEKTRWPIRYSGFLDEYQAYHLIRSENLVGIRASILLWYQENYVYYLKKLKKMIIYMQEHNIDLPIYDYTRVADYNVHLINSNAYLELYGEIDDSLHEKELKHIKK